MMGYNLTNKTINLYFCIGFIFMFIPLVVTVILVSKTIKLVDSNFLYELMRDRMKEEITNRLQIEIDDNLFRRILNEECQRHNLVFEPWFTRRNFLPLRTNKIGLIKDINLNELENFGNLIREIPNREGIEILGVITTYPGQYTSLDNNVLGFVNVDEEIALTLALELNKAFIIKKGG